MYTAAMAQKRSINSAGRRQCHFKQLKMALSSTSRVNRSFLSHCCSVAGSHSKNGTQDMKLKLIFFGGLLGRLQLAAMQYLPP